jgi:F0F1-type ATP synthase assembly protein I
VAGAQALWGKGIFAVLPAGQERGQQSMWNGFSNALARAVELVGTVLVFVLIGLWIDSRLGTKPLFTVVLGLLAILGQGIVAYYRYKAEVAAEEGEKPWRTK